MGPTRPNPLATLPDYVARHHPDAMPSYTPLKPRPSATADIRVRSSDGVTFEVTREALLRASPVFYGLLADVTKLAAEARDKQHPVLQLDEEAATVGAILWALGPLPTTPIGSLPFAMNCFRAANKYLLPYTHFSLDEPAFRSRGGPDFERVAFVVCAMSWQTGQWALVEHAARFTHSYQEEDLFLQATGIPGAYEALAAVMATRAERASCIAAVVHLLPLSQLACVECHAARRSAISGLMVAITKLFSDPYPDLTALFHAKSEAFLAHPRLFRGCECRTCRASVESHKFTQGEVADISEALAKVPQTVRRSLAARKVEEGLGSSAGDSSEGVVSYPLSGEGRIELD